MSRKNINKLIIKITIEIKKLLFINNKGNEIKDINRCGGELEISTPALSHHFFFVLENYDVF